MTSNLWLVATFAVGLVYVFAVAVPVQRRRYAATWRSVADARPRSKHDGQGIPDMYAARRVLVRCAGQAVEGNCACEIYDDGLVISPKLGQSASDEIWFPYAIFEDVGEQQIAVRGRGSGDVRRGVRLDMSGGDYVAIDLEAGTKVWGRWRSYSRLRKKSLPRRASLTPPR